MHIQEKVELKDWTWWKIGGPADYFCLPETPLQVREADGDVVWHQDAEFWPGSGELMELEVNGATDDRVRSA